MDALHKATKAIYTLVAITFIILALMATGNMPKGDFYIIDVVTNNSGVQNIERQLNQSPSDWFN